MTRGLIDAHAHLALHGRAMTMLALADCGSREECLQRIAARAAQTPPGAWILATGMRAQAWPGTRPPTAGELDEAAPGRAVAIWSFDHHAIAASSAALRAAEISGATLDPPGGLIERDDRGPTGLLLESAAHILWRAVPAPTAGEQREQVRLAAADFARRGIVEVHDMHAPLWLGPVLAELAEAGELPISVALYVPLAEIETAAREAPGWEREGVQLAGAKIFVDGTLNSRTAWMLSDYADPLPGLSRGKAMMTPGEIEAAVRRVEGLGLSLAAHAIGDAAVRATLDAIEAVGVPPPSRGAVAGEPSVVREALSGTGAGGVPRRHRIEHAEIIDRADIPRFAALGAICSPQPCHLLADIEALRRLLPHRLDRVLPLRELIDSGLRPGVDLVFGSDAPIVEPAPQDNVIAATLRRREGMPVAEAIAPEQAIREAEAWAGMGG